MPRSRFFSLVLLGGAALALAGCDGVLGSLAGDYDGAYPRKQGLTEELVIVRVVQGRSEAPSQLGGFYADRVALLGSPTDVNRLALVEARDFQPALGTADLEVGDTVRVTTQYVGFYFVGLGSQDVPNWNPEREDFEGTFPVARQKLLKIEKVGAQP